MASISAALALGIGGALSAAGSITSGVMSANAAGKAASQESAADQKAIAQEQQGITTATNNAQPYLSAGTASLSQLLTGLSNGTYGAGSIPTQPTAPGSFTAPTLADAKNDPGYQFSVQQGNEGILQSAAASGGTISGATTKSLIQYGQSSADTAYNDVFSRDLQSYGANITGYQAQLQGLYAQLAAKNQAFQQNLAPVTIGANTTNNLNSGILSSSNNIASLLTGQGQAQAAGTIGAQNSINSTIGSLANTGGALTLGETAINNPQAAQQLQGLGTLLNPKSGLGGLTKTIAG